MTDPRPEVLDFLLTRRSRSPKTLGFPVPDDARLKVLLTAAARSPDHGVLVPWRFIVLRDAALTRLSGAVMARAAALGMDEAAVEKAGLTFKTSPLAVAVISSPKDSPKVPVIEQHMSAGSVCYALVNAALADGWDAGWVTGFTALDGEFLTRELGLAEGEFVAGYVHIGTAALTPPDRPRPDLDAITTWVDE